jgi:hypothetical protein
MTIIEPPRPCAIMGRGACTPAPALVLAACAAAALVFCDAARAESAATAQADAANVPAAAHPSVELAAFEWLAGDWVIIDGKRRIEETWTRPAADMMLGMSRTLDGERTVSFEFVRIAARPDGVFYIAQPGGRPPVAFPLQSWDGTSAVFVNDGSSDHLKRIVYRREGGGLTASVEGSNRGHDFVETYPYRRPDATRATDAR